MDREQFDKLAAIAIRVGYKYEAHDVFGLEKDAAAGSGNIKAILSSIQGLIKKLPQDIASGVKSTGRVIQKKLSIKPKPAPAAATPKPQAPKQPKVTKPATSTPKAAPDATPSMSVGTTPEGFVYPQGPTGNVAVTAPNQMASVGAAQAYSAPSYAVGEGMNLPPPRAAAGEAATELASRPYRGRWLLAGLGVGAIASKPFSSNEGVPPAPRVYG